jgi:hypothetical protein
MGGGGAFTGIRISAAFAAIEVTSKAVNAAIVQDSLGIPSPFRDSDSTDAMYCKQTERWLTKAG